MKASKKNKQLLIEHLEKTPIVELACNKVNIAKATFYNWKRDDPEFAKQVEEALSGGKDLVSDVAESQLIGAIKSGNLSAAIFWLKHHRDDYRPHLEISGQMKHIREELTDEEAELLRETLKLAGFSPAELLPPPEEKAITSDNEPSHV